MSYAVMPLGDWQNILNSVRAKTGKTAPLVSADVPREIYSIVGGDCSGRHIIEVDEVPVSGYIDGDSLYLCDGTYYEPVRSGFVDIIAYDPARGPFSLLDDLPEGVEEVGLYLLPEKPSNAEVSDMVSEFHFYFIRKENDIFVYTDTWHRLSEMESVGLPGHGMITEISEATQEGYYALFDADAWGLEPLTNNGGGSGGGGSAELNIAYGNTAPADTSKLWVKTAEPSGVIVSKDRDYRELQGESLETLSATLPAERGRGRGEAVGTKIYLFGGVSSHVGSATINTIVCFDTETQTPATLTAVLPTSAQSFGSAVVGTKIYLFGGYTCPKGTSVDFMNTINVFDTEKQEIETLTATCNKFCGIACSAVGTKVYLFGGQQQTNQTKQKIIQCFDTETQTIETLSATLSEGLSDMGCVSIGTKIYLFGGDASVSGGYTYRDYIQCFDTETQTIETVARLPEAMSGSSVGCVDDIIYVFGGVKGNNSNVESYSKKCYRFNTIDQTIEEMEFSLPNVAAWRACGVVGKRIYLLGGSGSGGSSTTSFNNIICYSAAILLELLENGFVQIVPNAVKNLFNLFNTENMKIEIGVTSVCKGNADNEAEQIEAALYKDGAWTTI